MVLPIEPTKTTEALNNATEIEQRKRGEENPAFKQRLLTLMKITDSKSLSAQIQWLLSSLAKSELAEFRSLVMTEQARVQISAMLDTESQPLLWQNSQT